MTEKQIKGFNPDEHLISIKGQSYLPVSWRIVWLRSEHPDWSIETEIQDDPDKQRATAKATVKDETGRIIATGHKTAKPRGIISDYVELAETGSIGRALAYCGYGTQFSPDILEGDEDGNVVDSPIEVKSSLAGNVEAAGTKTITGKKATSAQVKAIYAMATRVGFDEIEVKDTISTKYGVKKVEDLGIKEASELIGEYSKMMGKSLE
jgi:hypothetical protein